MEVHSPNFHISGIQLVKDKTFKLCSDVQCYTIIPLCCLGITSDCSETISKWYHLSNCEHICNACCTRILSFFCYENNCTEVTQWKNQWITMNGYENAAVNDFIASKILPYWIQCIDCKKWRQVNFEINFSNEMKCCNILSLTKDSCSIKEEKKVTLTKDQPDVFLLSMDYDALLETCPFIDKIFASYAMDTIGFYPNALADNSNKMFQLDKTYSENFKIVKPFCEALGGIDPTTMDIWEMKEFPYFKGKQKSLYLGLRNLILVLWAANPKEPVSIKLLHRCLIIRGILRVVLLDTYLPQMLQQYTTLGYINNGLIKPELLLTEPTKHFIVIGANLSGISAALHLVKLGFKVTVLEASSSVELDNTIATKCSLNLKKTLQHYFELEGSLNNPLALMAHQCEIEMKSSTNNLVIFHENGKSIEQKQDQFYQDLVYNFVKYIDEHSSIIDIICQQSNLLELYKHYRLKKSESPLESSTKIHPIESVYLSELEFRLFHGRNLKRIDTKELNWCDVSIDNRIGHGYCYSSRCHSNNSCHFHGNSVQIHDWYKIINEILTKFSIDIQYNSQVTDIDNKNSVVTVANDASCAVTTVAYDGIVISTRHCKMQDMIGSMNVINQQQQMDATTTIPTVQILQQQPQQRQLIIYVTININQSTQLWRQLSSLIGWDKTNHLLCSAFSIVAASNEKSSDWRGFCPVFRHVRNTNMSMPNNNSSTSGQVTSCGVLTASVFSSAADYYAELMGNAATTKNSSDSSSSAACRDTAYKSISEGLTGLFRSLLTGDFASNLPLFQSIDISPMWFDIESERNLTEDLPTNIVTIKSKMMSEPGSITNAFVCGQEAAVKLYQATL